MIRSLIKKKFPARRLALSVGLSGSLLALNAAHAQTSNASANTSTGGETTEVERVVVTGSNIPTAAEVGASPLDTVDQGAIDRSGTQDVLSVLQKSDPSFSGGGNIGQSNADTNANSTLGGSTISIHGLPTLVLLNGRRVALSGAAASGGDAFVDVNLFPTALIKRIEVLKDGASAIYGSEAIGGVVNIILNQDFRGVEIDGRYGFTEKSDIKDKRVSLIAGVGDDKTSIVIGGQYTEQDPIRDTDRDFSKTTFGTTNYPGVLRLADGTGYHYYRLNTGVTTDPTTVTGNGTLTTPAQLVAAGVLTGPFASSTPIVGGFNLSNGTDITLDQNRTSLFGSFARELWTDHINFYGEFLYSHNFSQSQLNAQPINLLESDAAGNYITIPAGVNNPFNFVVGGNPASAAGNTAANGIIDVRNRFVDFPRVTRTDTDFYRVVAGLKGSIVKSIDLDYDISFNTSQDEINSRATNLLQVANLNAGLANGTINLFSVGNQDAALNNNGVFGTNFRDQKTALNVFDIGFTAFPFKLPAGPVGFAIGYEYRFEKIRYNDSPEIFLGSVPVADTNVGRDIDAAYSELSIPVIGPAMKLLGVYSLDLDGAVRMEKYDGINSSFVPKASFVYRPIEDVAVRGSFSKSFIAPTLFELFGAPGAGFSQSVDLGQGSEQSQEQGVGNPHLDPSTADTYSTGIVISPHQVPGFTLSGDFFHVEQKNIIGSFPDVTILNSVNNLGTASPYAGLVAFGNYPGRVGSAPVTGPGQLAGNLDNVFIFDPLANLGRVRIGGIDFNANYTHDFEKIGGFTAGVSGVYYLQYKEAFLPGQATFDTIGFYLGEANEVPQYRLTPYAEYRYGGLRLSGLGNYTPSVRDAHNIDISAYEGPAKDGYLTKIRDYFTVDLLLSYEFGLAKPSAAGAPAPKDGKDHVVSGKDGKDGKTVASSHEMAHEMMALKLLDGLKLGFGINNVSNARPPKIGSSRDFDSGPDATNTDAALYDPYQRLYYFTIAKKF